MGRQRRFPCSYITRDHDFPDKCGNGIITLPASYSLAISPGKEAVNVYFQLRDRYSYFIPPRTWKRHILRSLSLQPYLQYTQDS